MKKLIMIGFMFSSIAAQATESYYDRAKTMFEQGTIPSTEDLLGINVGRCFLRDDPYAVADGIIISRIGTSAGPIDDSKVVAMVLGSNAPVGYFDTATHDREFVTHTLNMLPIRFSADSLLIDNKVSDQRKIITFEVRKNESYLTYRLGTYEYCYTFIKR